MRLNGWQRIGIVLSVVWAIVGAIWADYAIYSPIAQAEMECMRVPAPGEPLISSETCIAMFNSQMAAARTYSPQFIFLAAFAPIGIGWLVAYGLIGLVRWIRWGFTPEA